MMDKIGRNDLCLCGSGKKYKKCCLSKDSPPAEIVDLALHQLRQMEGSVIDNHLLPYVMELLPKEVVRTVLEAFFPEDLPEAVDEEILFACFFMPWFLFNWIPFDDFDLEYFEPQQSIALNYLIKYENKLNSTERQFIEAMSKTHYSFYSVLEVELEKSMVVKDILLGITHRVKERQATQELKRGDILFGRILTLNDQSIFVDRVPYIIPVSYQNYLIDFRKWLIEENDHHSLTASVLRDELEIELFDYFFEVMSLVYSAPFPTLLNTDDELIQFSKSYFTLYITPEEVFKCLFPLTLSKSPEEFLQEAERDSSGKIKRIEFPWLRKKNKKHKDWDNTVMGQIIIDDDKLILETNSEQRTERGKKLLSQYLGEAVRFQKTLIESPEQKLKSSPEFSDSHPISTHFLQSPEVQEKLKPMVEKHWENWLDEPIPALGNKTPCEAAKTEEGREELEALLLQYERHDLDRGNNNLFKADIPYLRAQLALG